MTARRNLKLSASLEDYLEAIFNLCCDGQVARSKDIAEMLEVSRASVTGALRTLADKGLVNYRPYGFITLTEQGSERAEQIAAKHEIIKTFFVDVLGVADDDAGQAACKAEHLLGPAIVSRLVGFMDFVKAKNQQGCDLADEFARYCKRESK